MTGFTVTGNQVAASFVFWDMHVGNISLPVEVILFLRFNDEGEITQVRGFLFLFPFCEDVDGISMTLRFDGQSGSLMLCWPIYHLYSLHN